MADTVHCDSHGESEVTFTCSHLADGAAGIGFNRAEPTEEEPFPDTVCDECDLILEAHGGWTDESEKLIEIRLLCSRCYELCRIRNTRTDVTFEDVLPSSLEVWFLRGMALWTMSRFQLLPALLLELRIR